VATPIVAGAEPFSASNGQDGVLVIHGFTGSPRSMRPLAEAFADAGYSVELPLLPGHGTSLEDMLETTFADWSGGAEEAYQSLAARCNRVMVAGLSMGGTLSLWLAEQHPEITGLVLVNPLVEQGAESFYEMLHGILDAGMDRIPAVGEDIALEGVTEGAYEATPVKPLLSLMDAAGEVSSRLGEVSCPVLLLSSRSDHVVPPSNGDLIVERVAGPVERVWLERSFHVATLDHDQAEIEQRAVEFASKVFSS
jgi:carboxylesterase